MEPAQVAFITSTTPTTSAAIFDLRTTAKGCTAGSRITVQAGILQTNLSLTGFACAACPFHRGRI